MRKWEYLRCHYDDWESLDGGFPKVKQYKTIAEAGLDGWEFVQRVYKKVPFDPDIEHDDGIWYYDIFKREIPETVGIKDEVMTLEKFQRELTDFMKKLYGG